MAGSKRTVRLTPPCETQWLKIMLDPGAIDPPPPLLEPPPPRMNQPGVPRHKISNWSVPRPAASTEPNSVAITDGDTGAVPLLLPPPGNGCATINAAANTWRIM